MLILIAGIGNVGKILTEYISKENHDIVVIETDNKILETAINKYDVKGILGNGASWDILNEAGAARADLIIAVTESDELNILCCLIAKRMGTKHTIARVRDPIYLRQLPFMRDEFEINMIINPEFEAASEISRLLRFPSAIKIDVFAKGRVELVEIKLTDNSPLIGKTLSELPQIINSKLLVCAVQRNEEVIIPSGNFTMRGGDDIYITASHHDMSFFFKKIGIFTEKIKSVIIIGGSDIAYYLSVLLDEQGIAVKIIEQDKARCLELGELLPNVEIAHGDGTDRAILLEESIENTGACISLTNVDEANVIISLYANKLKVKKVITKIDEHSFSDILDSIGIESIISPKYATANNILRYVRAMEHTSGGSVQTLYKLIDGKIEALEFLVKNNNEITGVALRGLKLKPNILVACIIRNNKLIYPHGSDTIESGDGVIIVTAGSIIKNIEDILE